MKAPEQILNVWHLFDSFPMETITKAWYLKNSKQPKQRTVNEMTEHRLRYGASGNCFDLAIWLMSEFKKAAIEAYFIGDNLGTTDAHVAVIALGSSGQRFLCDLGDLWIQPINLDAKVLNAPHFFTGAHVSLDVQNKIAHVEYLRTNGKKSTQEYNLNSVSEKDFLEAANFSQQNRSNPLIEMRIFNPNEVIHWEFENNNSYFSSLKGLSKEPPVHSLEDWSVRIEKMTNMKSAYVYECLKAFEID